MRVDTDWHDIVARLNAKFGKPYRTADEVNCSIPPENKVFWDAYDKLYEEREKEANEKNIEVWKKQCALKKLLEEQQAEAEKQAEILKKERRQRAVVAEAERRFEIFRKECEELAERMW